MEHLDEKTIEFFVMDSEAVRHRRKEIAKHLKQCEGCTERYQEILQYHTELDRLEREEYAKSEHALYKPERALRHVIFDQSVPVLVKLTLGRRLMQSFARYPVAWSGSIVLAFVALFLLYRSATIREMNPMYAKAQEGFLVAYDQNGGELWRNYVGSGYETRAEFISTGTAENLIRTVDVDGDGKNEIISIFGWIAKSKYANTVICYAADGKERWTYEFHRNMVFGNEEFSDDYRFERMMVADFAGNGNMEVVAIAKHVPYYPTAIVRLDARDGKLLGEYWHIGHIQDVAHKDIDGDGIQELFLAGENNALNLATLLVLDSRWIEGHSPSQMSDEPRGISSGTEKFYVAFPLTDVRKASFQNRSSAEELEFTADGLLRVGVDERVERGAPPGLHYYFEASMRCVKVRETDEFRAFHRKLENEGQVGRKLDSQYFEELRRGILYWNGEEFVREQTMNKVYRELAKE